VFRGQLGSSPHTRQVGETRFHQSTVSGAGHTGTASFIPCIEVTRVHRLTLGFVNTPQTLCDRYLSNSRGLDSGGTHSLNLFSSDDCVSRKDTIVLREPTPLSDGRSLSYLDDNR